MNFAIIFLSLLIGCVIGFEVGKYTAIRKVQEFMNKITDDMQKAAQKQKEEAEKKRKEAMEAIEDLGKIFETMKKIKEDRQGGDEDGDGVTFTFDKDHVDPEIIGLIEKGRQE